jgi:hypothetical protein
VLLLSLFACIDTSNCDGKLIEVSINHTSDNDGENVTGDDCYTVANGVYDYADCCPDGFTFLAMNSGGGVICEQECGGDELQTAMDLAFIGHGVLDAVVESVEDLNSPPP